MSIITVTDLSKSFGGVTVFSDLNLMLKRGFTCLYGPSGCGKTTLGRILAGLERADGGSVQGLVDETTVLFQEPRLLSSVSALTNVSCVSERRDAAQAATDLLAALGFSQEDCQKKPSELSGGMQQRVAIARALLYAEERQSTFVLLDEPFRGLDGETKAQAASLLKQRLSDRIVLVITHDEEDAVLLAAAVISFERFANPKK